MVEPKRFLGYPREVFPQVFPQSTGFQIHPSRVQIVAPEIHVSSHISSFSVSQERVRSASRCRSVLLFFSRCAGPGNELRGKRAAHFKLRCPGAEYEYV